LSTGWHGGDSDLRQILTPLFEDYRVDVVFNGHDHGYERSFKDGIYYVVTAGGGAPLRGQATTSDYSQVFDKTYNFCTLSVGSENVTVKAFDPDIGLVDEFSIEAR
jgi:hypothetical protein